MSYNQRTDFKKAVNGWGGADRGGEQQMTEWFFSIHGDPDLSLIYTGHTGGPFTFDGMGLLIFLRHFLEHIGRHLKVMITLAAPLDDVLVWPRGFLLI